MAASNTYFVTTSVNPDTMFEFDESDVWNNNVSVPTEFRKPVPPSRIPRRSSSSAVKRTTAASLPVSVPDWSKILKEGYNNNNNNSNNNNNRRRDSDDDDWDDDNSSEEWVPPHEFLARKRTASFSVHEGIGRTLKGRDLSRVRNAIWKKTGFED